LRAILGFASILEEEYNGVLDDEGRRITSVIKNNTEKMGRLIDDLLTFSRLGRQENPKTDIDIRLMVEDVVHNMSVEQPTENIRWMIGVLPHVKANRNMMRQVWVNLIANAIKYSGKKDDPQIEIGSFERDHQTVFFVKDNGVGFDQQYKDKLFKVFQRLHSAEEFEGTGIGLAIVDKIISREGGEVWAESTLGKGATFYFSLPGHDKND
jgi:light-regulated signal transduction histidine kinase (bacteriophytochrome)